MNILKTAGLLTAAVIAVSAAGAPIAGAVSFTDTDGVKTWTFNVTGENDYPNDVEPNNKGDMYFAYNTTYYAADGYTKDTSAAPGSYLTLTTQNNGTYESKDGSALYLNSVENGTSSALTYTAPCDGTISLTACEWKGSINVIHLAVNDNEPISTGSDKTVSADVKQGDTVTITSDAWAGFQNIVFAPSNTHTEMYSFTETANELNRKTLTITYNGNEQRHTKLNTTQATGGGEVRLGIIINNIPNDVTINSVVID